MELELAILLLVAVGVPGIAVAAAWHNCIRSRRIVRPSANIRTGAN